MEPKVIHDEIDRIIVKLGDLSCCEKFNDDGEQSKYNKLSGIISVLGQVRRDFLKLYTVDIEDQNRWVIYK